MTVNLEDINTQVKQESTFVTSILNEASKVIVGQTYVLERLLMGVLTGGHILLEEFQGW